jgi:molecular chaperone GrpE
VEEEFTVQDRRHSANENGTEDDNGSVEPRKPTIIDEYRQRTEEAEKQLQEYIEAFKQREREHDDVRLRLERDVDRKVELKFGGLARELLETMDVLDLSLSHMPDDPDPEMNSLANGVKMARDGFLATLERHGIERIAPDGEPFDPNVAEALRVDPVDSADRDGKVTETLQPGYRLGDFVIRAARVAVGRFTG